MILFVLSADGAKIKFVLFEKALEIVKEKRIQFFDVSLRSRLHISDTTFRLI